VVWVHESAAEAWGLPPRLGPDHADTVAELVGRGCRDVGDSGWLAVDAAPTVYLAFPAYSGDFSGLAGAGELLQAVELFRREVGFAHMFSGPSTVHKLIRSLARPGEPEEEPEVPFVKSAWTVPASSWGLTELEALEAAGRRWIRCFDRSGSYLSAWAGVTLPEGTWSSFGAGVLEVGSESAKPAGYWLLERQVLDELAAGMFDPFRRFGDVDGPVWLTTPLAQLATELAGEPVPYLEAHLAAERIRSLDSTAARLREAREHLYADPRPPAIAARRALKDGYSGATNWFENGKRHPDPLARPAWTRTIHDRYVANTYRSLAKATPGPWAFTEIDTALFAFDDVDQVPDEFRLGGLGGWEPKGRALSIEEAAAALATPGGHHAVVLLAEGRER
jgi:hypothetical protein